MSTPHLLFKSAIMIKRIVKLTFQKEKIPEFLTIFEESKQYIRQSEGCLRLELLRCANPDNVFFTYSFWENEKALNQYRYSEGFRQTWEKTKILFSDKPEAWSTKVEVEGF